MKGKLFAVVNVLTRKVLFESFYYLECIAFQERFEENLNTPLTHIEERG